jgi:hypothetical protein
VNCPIALNMELILIYYGCHKVHLTVGTVGRGDQLYDVISKPFCFVDNGWLTSSCSWGVNVNSVMFVVLAQGQTLKYSASKEIADVLLNHSQRIDVLRSEKQKRQRGIECGQKTIQGQTENEAGRKCWGEKGALEYTTYFTLKNILDLEIYIGHCNVKTGHDVCKPHYGFGTETFELCTSCPWGQTICYHSV